MSEKVKRSRPSLSKRNPRRSIVDVCTECVPYGQAMVSVSYCVLECGHKVEGYPDTLDGKKACPECGKEMKYGKAYY